MMFGLPLGFLVEGSVAVLLVVTLIVYPVTFETLLRGRTPGKAAMGLRVVRDDGGPIGFRQAPPAAGPGRPPRLSRSPASPCGTSSGAARSACPA